VEGKSYLECAAAGGDLALAMLVKVENGKVNNGAQVRKLLEHFQVVALGFLLGQETDKLRA
jgi:hypothetical protein